MINEKNRYKLGPGNYVLDENDNPVPCDDIREWAKGRELYNKVVSQTLVPTNNGLKRVSTVWLGVEHGFDKERAPLLWETMVFEGKDGFTEEVCERYSSKIKAIEGHLKIIDELRKS